MSALDSTVSTDIHFCSDSVVDRRDALIVELMCARTARKWSHSEVVSMIPF